jgi:hypothetical protein
MRVCPMRYHKYLSLPTNKADPFGIKCYYCLPVYARVLPSLSIHIFFVPRFFSLSLAFCGFCQYFNEGMWHITATIIHCYYYFYRFLLERGRDVIWELQIN